jgi:hypothetical protein
MNGMLRVPRSRGVLSGFLLLLLGIWGAVIPFIGPYFHYAFTPDRAWVYTSGRLWLEVLPGAATFLGGLLVLVSAYRHMALFGAWLAALSGAWFALGTVLRPIWHGSGTNPSAGTPVGGTLLRMWEQVGFFTGLGVVIVLFAASALGRFTVIGVRDARLAAQAAPPERDTDAPETPARETTTRETTTRETTTGTRSRFTVPWRRTADSEDSESSTEPADSSSSR